MVDHKPIFDDEDLQKQNKLWNPEEWIGCGLTYRDVPEHVALEAVRLRQIPSEVLSTLPSELLSPAGFFANSNLPSWDPAYDSKDAADVDFDATEPTLVPQKPSDIRLLSVATIRRLDNTFGQAWFDGKKSIRDARDPNNVQHWPLYFLTYAESLRQTCRCWVAWRAAIFWALEEHDDEEPEEVKWRQRTVNLLSSIVGWSGRVGCGLGDLSYEHLAEVLGENMLMGSVVDALVHDIKTRLTIRDGTSSEHIIGDTMFARCMTDGAATSSEHMGYRLIARYTHLLSSDSASRPRYLSFPLHSPPLHWAACMIDLPKQHIHFGDSLQRRRPQALFDELLRWLTEDVGLQKVKITDDLTCGLQKDHVNCGIISANTLAHAILGDTLWDHRHARTYRYRAFCTIASIILRSQEGKNTVLDVPFLDPFETHTDVETPAAAPAVAPATLHASSQVQRLTDEDITEFLNHTEESQYSVPAKRLRKGQDADSNDEGPVKKRTKTDVNPSACSKAFDNPDEHSSTLNGTQPWATKVAVAEHVQLDILESLRTGGQGNSSRHDRVVGILIKHGLFRGNAAKLERLRRECKRDDGDPRPGLDINNPKQVICSRCAKTVQLKAVYEAGRFREHWRKGCKKTPVPNKSITNFFGPKSASFKPVPQKLQPSEFIKHCPGLTGAVHPRIDYYIDHCPASGAGARTINFYVAQLFEEKRGIVSISDPSLSRKERTLAYHHQSLDRDWRIETSPHRASVVATRCLIRFAVYREADVSDNKVVCTACWAVFLRKEFRTAINRNRDKTYQQLIRTPKLYSNPIQYRLMAQYEGLEALLTNPSKLGVMLRFARGVALGHYNDLKVFLGLVETMVLATERRIRGVGMQNFKYPQEWREFGALIRMTSPRSYRSMAQHFRMESERSIQHTTSQRPRFPLGITEKSFEILAQYCQDYGYPSNYPLCFSVDDTKLFPAMQPLYDGPSKTWYLVGLPGAQQLQVKSAAELETLIDRKHNAAPKLRLWSVQIPFPGIPPLAFAVLPIASKVKGSELV
ncbi:hypothetical protein GGX14DRAFT_575691 [Mycena pura]|uniref:Ubiquitin-like protease family profile domain-containing protein n=1 Tax=Mycena pura TaxID=153505 RepID=A0AAD6UWS7_9AGAR|nr:hypothetical protein GGX14DRAFT_575691 [Mycena pura]